MAIKESPGAAMARLRWAGKTAEEKLAHAMMMVRARTKKGTVRSKRQRKAAAKS